MIKKIIFSLTVLCCVSFFWDLHASASMRFEKLGKPAKLLALSAGAAGSFVAYHEAQYHRNHRQVVDYYNSFVKGAQAAPGYKEDNFYLASRPFIGKAARHYPFALVTRGLQESGLYENSLAARYSLIRLRDDSLVQMKLNNR